MPYDKYFHIGNFYVCRCSAEQVFLKCSNIYRKSSVSESFLNKVTGLYPATLLKEKILIQVFSETFWEILKAPFLHLKANASVLQKKYFTNKIVKIHLKKDKKLKTTGKKSNHICNKKLKHYLHQVFISFTIQKFIYSSFHYFP